MVDSISQDRRSDNMRRIRAKNTKPEMIVRRMLHVLGYRYRLHAKELPGKPDIVFRIRKKVIFVHGCFWHRHEGCSDSRLPSTRQDFWRAKLGANVFRGERQIADLEAAGWQVLVIWECETVATADLQERLTAFLGPTTKLPYRQDA